MHNIIFYTVTGYAVVSSVRLNLLTRQSAYASLDWIALFRVPTLFIHGPARFVNGLLQRLSIVLRTRTIRFNGDNFVRFIGAVCTRVGRTCFKENSSPHISSVKAAVFLARFPNNLFPQKCLFIQPTFRMTVLVIRTKFSVELHTIAYFRHWTDNHYCKNSLSSLHSSIRHSTFCASLHVKQALLEEMV